MKVKTDDLSEPLRQIIPNIGKDAPGTFLQSGSPFSHLLQNFMARQTEGKSGIESFDKEQLMTLVEMMSLQMSYTAMSMLGSPEDGSGDGHASSSSFFSSLSSIPSLDSFDKAQERIGNILQRNETSGQGETEFASIIDKASRTYGVDRNLIQSVIKAESDFNPDATSSKGAMGLMQLMPDTARGLGVKDAYDPEENIMGGTRYLKWLLDRYNGDVPCALAAYNWGMGNVDRGTGRLPDETREYIARVMKSYRGYNA